MAATFPDPQVAAVTVLRNTPDLPPGLTFGTKTWRPGDPPAPPLPHVVVSVDLERPSFAAQGDAVATRVDLRLVAHAESEYAAGQLARWCVAALHAHRGGQGVRYFRTTTGPIPSYDLDTGSPVSYFTVQARLRPVAVTP